jgi:hypothetical protein
MAQESKTTLVARILELERQIETSADPTETAALEKELASYQKQKEAAELTQTIADTVMAGLGKDWRTQDPAEKKDNYAWAIEAALGLWLGGSYVIEKRRSNEKNKKIETLIANGNKGSPTPMAG